MDRKVFLALILSAVVVVVFNVLFPPPKRPVPTAADSARLAAAVADSVRRDSAANAAADAALATPVPAAGATAQPGAPADSAARALARAAAAETTVVENGRVRYVVASLGARPVSARLLDYQALDANGRRTAQPVELVRRGDALVGYRLVIPGDTILLNTVPFTVTRTGEGAATRLEYRGTATSKAGVPIAVTIAYTFTPDYLVRVEGTVQGAPQPAYLAAELPRVLASAEADTVEDSRHRAIAYKNVADDAVGIPMAKVPVDERIISDSAVTWAVAKSKYFIVGFLTPEKGRPFREVQVRAQRTANVRGWFGTSVVPTAVDAVAITPVPADGRFAFEVYAGPQEFERLQQLGRAFEESNPYGGWLQGIVQPFATIVMKILLWMKRNVALSYGWILVIFGVAVRLVMWPFQQRAMRSSMVMQRIQPEMQRVQEKYRNDPQKLQSEMMKIYKEHGVSPFSAFSGCLPMLIPMPVFFALFFVFQNTIEFRGVPFLWLPDISLYDPLFILPLVMGLSSWFLAWVGMRNAPPNPQAKMMSYMFPVMMTVFLWKFASGLNLYYTVQNLAALPQQWLLSNERAKQAKK